MNAATVREGVPASSPPCRRVKEEKEEGEEQDAHVDRNGNALQPQLPVSTSPQARASALDFLALWRHASAPHGGQLAVADSSSTRKAHGDGGDLEPPQLTSSLSPPPRPQLGTLTVGSIVFAPHRVACAPPPHHSAGGGAGASASSVTAPPPPPPYQLHYALAEVTGIQACAGTVTLSFLFTDPGIDDEAVSLYECVPCPPATLARWLSEASLAAAPPRCSLLERALHVAAEAGPPPVSEVYRAVVSASPAVDAADPRHGQQRRCVSRLRRLYCLSDDDNDDDGPVETAKANPANGSSSPAGECAEGSGSSAAVPAFLTWTSAPRAAEAALAAAAFTARYSAPMSVHVFFSGVFQLVNTYMEQHCRGGQRDAAVRHTADAEAGGAEAAMCARRSQRAARRLPPVVLCIFDNYATLRRFHVFMTVRGHVVRLVDGAGPPARAAALPPLLPPVPQTTHAFGAKCKVWMCMLREDTGEEDARMETQAGAAEALVEAQLSRLLASAPAIDALVSFREHTTAFPEDRVTAESALRRLLPHLDAGQLVCTLQDVPALTPAVSAAAAAASPIKVSGAVFGDNKLLVPCSPEQLTLLSTVWVSAAPPATDAVASAAEQAGRETSQQPTSSPTGKGGRKRGRPSDDGASATAAAAAAGAHALTPALLERIALGSFTDVAAATLFDVFADAVAVVRARQDSGTVTPVVVVEDETGHAADGAVLCSVEEVYAKWCVDPARFGEAFPVFAAVYALIADVFAGAGRRTPRPAASTPSSAMGALPRIALVLPHGNPTHHPNLSTQQYLHTLRTFFAPWAVHEIPAATTALTSVGGSGGPALSSGGIGVGGGGAAPVLWHHRGGVLLLFCDEATTQLGALQDEADVVVACGKAAAAWVAANVATHAGSTDRDAPVLFAVISEVELVPPTEQLTHLWLPVSPSSLSASPAMKETSSTAVAAAASRVAWPATSSEEASCAELDALWRRLLATVGPDGGMEEAVRRAASMGGRRLHSLEVLPKTLRQAVVLWRHLQPKDADTRETRGTPWRALQAAVRELALACMTAMPVRTSDVVLVRQSGDL